MIARRSLLACLPPMALTMALCNSAAAAPPTRRTIGLSLPLTGVQGSVGREMMEAYEVAMKSAGAPFKLQVLDDQSTPESAANNVRTFCADPSVVAVSGIVGTPHAQACAPIAAAARMPVIGIRSGARVLRTPDNSIWHLRASFEEEITYIAQDAVGRGKGGMVVVFSDDSFGKASRDWMLSEMKRLGIEEVLAIAVDRDGASVPAVCEKVAAAINGRQGVTSIALLMITKPMVAAAKELRQKHKIFNPVFAMSFTANTLVTREQDAGLVGLGIITAFPLPRVSLSGGSVQFRKEMLQAKQDSLLESLTAYEAWFYGKTLSALAGAESREEVIARLEKGISLANFNRLIAFDGEKVGYRHIGMAYKSATGKLREA